MHRLLLLVGLLATTALFAQDKPKWDVNNPSAGVNYRDVEFTTSEGTWMNLDVSPDGQTLVFDLLGDIYKMPITGGAATCLRSGIAWEVQPRFSPDGSKILFTSDAGGGDNIWVMAADGTNPKQVTKESFRLLNNGEWIDNQYIVARKHFTNTRSLGAGEMWMYHLSGGDGVQLTKRKNDQQDVNEPTVSPDGRYVYFSEDLYGGGFFQYNKDPLKQIFAIRRYDRKEGKVEDVAGGSGGACRPQISPDGKWLAFVRRVDTKTVLFVRELSTGLEYPLYDQLDKDQQEAWTIFGCYPGFSWWQSMDGFNRNRYIVIWAGGKIKRLDLALQLTDVSPGGPTISGGLGVKGVQDIPFTCTVKTKVAETLRFNNKVFEPEFTARAIRHAVTSPDGKLLIFNAAGKLYRKTLPDGKPEPLVKGDYLKVTSVQAEYAKIANDQMLESEPCFSPDGKKVTFVGWNDQASGSLWELDLASGQFTQVRVKGGIFRTPQYAPDGKKLVFRLQDGDDEFGPAQVEKTGVYWINLGETTWVTPGNNPGIHFVTNEGENPRFSNDGQRVLVQTGGALFGGLDKSLKSFNLDGNDEQVHVKSKYGNSFVVSPDGKWLAFNELHKSYICSFPEIGKPLDLSADTKAVPLAQASRDAGYNLHWSGNSKTLHYTLGDEYFSIDLTERFSFLEGAAEKLPPLDSTGVKINLTLNADRPDGALVLEGGRIVTMEGDRVIENGVVVVENNKITFVGSQTEYQAARLRVNNPKVVDCSGKTIMPGIVDVHAHTGNFRFGLNPQKQWEYYANLAYGVTTMHDPSVNSEMAFSNAEMLKTGRMVGPRLFSTGTILYGADGDFKAPINSLDDARSTLRRTKAWGAFSVKSYNQPRREQRQWVIAAAKELKMEVVPEGGSFFYHNLTQVVDGHTGIEHNIPVAPIYNDVITLWGKTGAHNTPTLIVCYGAVNGEYYWFQHSDVWKKSPLRDFTPPSVLNERARHRTMIPDEEYTNGYQLVSRQLKKMQDAGININLGSHGQLQGLGAHWELWMLQQGGMSNLQALRCATINGAVYLGLDQEIGSLKAGKLADLLILDANPLDDIRNSEKINQVMVNGRLYNAATLNETGRYDRKPSSFWFKKPGSNAGYFGPQISCDASRCSCRH